MILLDTNVLSEALKSEPAAEVVEWLNSHFPECALSSVTVFELLAGVAMLAKGKRKEILERAIRRALRRFSDKTYAFDADAARAAAALLAEARANGLPLQQVPIKLADLQIAGIASAYGLDLATRNVSDFAGLGLTVVNPWNAS